MSLMKHLFPISAGQSAPLRSGGVRSILWAGNLHILAADGEAYHGIAVQLGRAGRIPRVPGPRLLGTEPGAHAEQDPCCRPCGHIDHQQ